MAEMLKEWLTERLQRPIKWEAQEFGDMMKNGHIVATVLHSYHVINEEKLFLIRPSNLQTDVKSNWGYLSGWLRELDISLNAQELNKMTEGKGSAFLRLFYQLFLTLDKRDRTNFLKREQKMVSNLVEKMEHRFIVDAVDETQKPDVDYLSKPLINEKHYIEWQKKKAKEIKEANDFARYQFKKATARIQASKATCYREGTVEAPKNEKLTSKDQDDIAKFCAENPCAFKNITYEELVQLEEKSALRKKQIVDTEWAKAYMENLYRRIHKRTDSEEFQKELRNVLSNSMWDLSVGHEEAEVDLDLAKKVMKLSQFEKQMCTQIMETKQQARNLIKNRIDAEVEFADQRELQFHQYLDNLKEQLHLEAVEIDFEKQRQEVLHQRLYAEKMKRKRQHWYEICYETMLSIVDYATKIAFWTRLLENDLPDHFIHEWKNLYYKKQPIFDILEPMEDLLKEQAIEEEPAPEVEEIIRLELDRQLDLNDSEFLEYHHYLYPWNLDRLIPNYDPENEERKFEYLGNRILGHVVYTLKEIKYPYVPPRPPADLPCFPSKAVIRGLPDKAIAVAMQTLLAKSNIHVVRIEAAVNYCLRQFKHEMVGCTDIDLQYDKFIAVQPEESGKDFLKSLKQEEEGRSKSSDASISAISGPIPLNCKQTQTPKVLPEEDITLSASADLGKYAYEALSFGDTLTDHLIAAMLVEYIKDQVNIKGFVIINYPNTYREAQILEETFQGREPPDEAELMIDKDDIYLEETIAKHRKKEKDPYKELRKSRIVDDPHKRKRDLPFESYFTCYLRMKETDDILQEYVIWDLTEENSELIDRFYAALGINYSVYYEIIEKDLLSQICMYVIGDLSLPLKAPSTLFGENVLSELEFPWSDDRRTKSKIIKPEVSFIRSKEKLKRISSKGSKIQSLLEIVKPADSNMEVPYEAIIPVEEMAVEEQSKVSLLSEIKVLPGEEEWIYGELEISEFIGVALTKLWEELERVYIHDLQHLFFAKRLQMNSIIPYCRFIKEKLEQVITLPSFKQDLVSSFQKEYNEFEDDWRDVTVVKNEWHCRIAELQQRLYNICDERKLYAEQMRHSLHIDNWITEESTSMTNVFVSCMQTEVNRSTLTFQIMRDFYYASLKKLPPCDKLPLSCLLMKINKEIEDTSASHGSGATSSKRPTEDKIYKQLKLAFLDMQVKNIVLDISNNPVFMILENNVKLGVKHIKDINDHHRSLVASEYNEIAKMIPNVKRDKDDTSQETLCSEEVFKENGLRAVEEWVMGINGEMYRLNQRLVALQYKCLHDLRLLFNTVRRAFEEIQEHIDAYYVKEIKSVDRLCKYMQMAVENGRKIPETLILENDYFMIDPNLLQFEPTERGPTTVCQDDNVNLMAEFKISQLARLRSQFKIVAPTGLALQQAFIYLLQDFIFFGKESCEGSLFPPLFKRIDPEKIGYLTYQIFGDTAYVDWKDFLVYCLNLRFPSMEELLSIRRRFRCNDCCNTELIDREEFISEPLWYEDEFDSDPPSQLRKNLIKHFLFELYEVKTNKTNYSALLLAFCKSVDPKEGFAKALAMAVGKKICYLWSECQEVVCQLIKLKYYHDECLVCANKCANEVLDKIFDQAMQSCLGTTIEELPWEETKTETIDKKSKKKAQSARASAHRLKEDADSTKAKSELNVKQTFICPPCREPSVIEEEKIRWEAAVEEEQSVASEDPGLTYAVPQSVIWNVLKICLPWHFALIPDRKTTPYEEQVREIMKKLEGNHPDGDIYVSQFIAEPEICKILHKVKKFTAYVLSAEVQNVLV